MLDRIAFLCTDPWEQFLPAAAQSRSREYFRWICEKLKRENCLVDTRELIEIYGENQRLQESEIFHKTGQQLQMLYVQSGHLGLLEKVFEWSDLVVMGMPGCEWAFEKMLTSVFPWKQEILFLRDQQYCRGEQFVKRLCRKYCLQETQMIRIYMKKAPVI